MNFDSPMGIQVPVLVQVSKISEEKVSRSGSQNEERYPGMTPTNLPHDTGRRRWECNPPGVCGHA